MVFRTAGAVAALMLGLTGIGGQQALAQYYPAPQAYPPQAYPPQQPQAYPRYRPMPSMAAADDDAPSYDPPMGRPMPPAAIGQQDVEPLPPPGLPIGRRGVEEADLPPPPGAVYREPPPGYVPIDPGARVARPYYGAPPDAAVAPPPLPPMQAMPNQAMPNQGPPPDAQPVMPQGFEPAAAGTRPYYPPAAAAPADPDAMRPPLAIGPGQFANQPPPAPGRIDPNATGTVRGDQRFAALGPDYQPETGPAKALAPRFQRTMVDYRTKEPAGTIVIDTPNTYLYLVLGDGKAMRYGVGVGREGFTWTGAEKVTRMAEWPDWHPPEEMIERQPYLPRFMAGGPGNPLGARALYLGKTVYRIHGTNQPSTIGTFVSSGCIRLTNEDVQDLYTRVKVGTRVVVLPGGKPPATASAVPAGPAASQGYQGGYQGGYQQGYQGYTPPPGVAR
jgi:lipoprotein-anchoring transpeptidase ErfK/SrfK